jgi:site-specific recombinase XerD
MASLRFELSVKKNSGDRPEFQAVLRFGNPQRKIRCRTGLYGFSEYWNNDAQEHKIPKAINPLIKPEVVEVNKKLGLLKVEVDAAADNTPDNEINRAWLAEIVEDLLHPTKKEKEQQDAPKTLIQAVEDFIAAAPTTIRHKGKPICAARLNHYKQVLKNLQGMGADGVTIERADKSFYDSFVRYMFANGYKQNTIATRVKCIKSVINSLPMAERVGCEFVEPKKCAAVMEDIDNCYLDEKELQTLADLDLADNPCLDRVRDQFLLLAWTGCRYSDLGKLTRRYIVNEDGDDCFKLEQQKTGSKVVIPILPPIVPILEKYDYQPPKPISNQRFNDYIKQVAQLAHLEDEVTTIHTQQMKGDFTPDRVETRRAKWQAVTAHSARRSFATNMYKRGFPTLAIMAITGHKTEKSFLTYIKVSEAENATMVLRQFKSQWK